MDTSDPRAPLIDDDKKLKKVSYGSEEGAKETTSDEPGSSSVGAESTSREAPPELKRKKPGFLDREVIVTNPDKIERSTLLTELHGRFTSSFSKWSRKAKIFKFANLFVTLAVVLLQLTQVIVNQVPGVGVNQKQAIGTIIPAVTGAILAIQLKLAWSEKGQKSKKTARLFSLLVKHVEYRQHMLKSGGIPDELDAIKLWNTALLSETKDVPSFLLAY